MIGNWCRLPCWVALKEMKMNVRNRRGALSVVICAALSGHFSAHAQVLAVATVEGTYTQPVNSSSWQAIPVRMGATALPFKTTQNNQTVVITYSASCIALSFTVSVRANIDGLIAGPGTKTGVTLCSNTLSGSTYPASRTFSAVIATKGTHNVSIELKGSSNAGIVIGDSALVVEQ